ncbi:MAG TPA: hypothetical protein VFP31_01730 [Gaiellaceae bacterium]|nr:hypothetical protein [Gaiellaceae bacterium]
MRRARIFVLAAGVASLLGVVGIAYASEAFDGAKPATARFHDLDKAIKAGYSFRLPELSGATCIALPGVGGMGVHMVNTSLLDGTIDAEAPEALVYEEKADGELKLAAVEYVVFQGDWKGSKPPVLFGREFDLVPAPNRFGLPSFYALHAWIWKPNPSGILSAWNPRVTCG